MTALSQSIKRKLSLLQLADELGNVQILWDAPLSESDKDVQINLVDGFINDHIIRSLAGVTERGRPVFLKIVYRGPKAMEELAAYDSNLIVGIEFRGKGLCKLARAFQ